MSCEQKIRLAMAYDAATAEFSEAVAKLRQNMGIVLKDEYDRLERACTAARLRSEETRLALEEHIAGHHC